MKVNAYDLSKKLLVLFITLLVAGVIILCVFGFNKGQEFAGRIEIDVNIGGYNIVEEKDVKEFTNEVIKVIKDNDGEVLQTNIQDDSFESVLVISVKAKSGDRNENVDFANTLKSKIDEKYNDELLITSARFESGNMSYPSIVTLCYVTLFSIIIAMIYLIIRVKLPATMCILATCFTSVILFVDLIILTRIEVNSNIIGLIIISAISGLIIPSVKFFDLKSRGTKITLDDCLIPFGSASNIFSCITILAIIPAMIIGTPVVRNYALAIIVLLVSLHLANSNVSMPLYYYITNYTTPKYKVVPEKVEKVSKASEEPVQETVEEETEESDDTQVNEVSENNDNN